MWLYFAGIHLFYINCDVNYYFIIYEEFLKFMESCIFILTTIYTLFYITVMCNNRKLEKDNKTSYFNFKIDFNSISVPYVDI